MVRWFTGRRCRIRPLTSRSARWFYGAKFVRFFVARDATFDPDRLDPEKFRDRLLQLSDLLDSTTPPFKLTASRPMYRYPNYPHYTGGDRLRAESYRCAPAAP
jgi:hypothetical protein